MECKERQRKVRDLIEFYKDYTFSGYIEKAPVVPFYEEGNANVYFIIKNFDDDYEYHGYDFAIIGVICARSGEYVNQECRQFSFSRVDERINGLHREMQKELLKRMKQKELLKRMKQKKR